MIGIDDSRCTRRRSRGPDTATTRPSATSTSASARCSPRCATGPRRRHAGRLHRRPRRACSASAASGTRCRSSRAPRACRCRARPRPGGRVAWTRPSRSSTSPPRCAELAGHAAADGRLRGHAASPGRSPAPGRSGRGARRVPGRGRAGARGDDPARHAQVRALPGRPRPALRPRGRPARAATTSRPAPTRRSSLRRSGPRATSAGISRRSSATCSRASARGGWSPRRSAHGAYAPWDFQPLLRRLAAVCPERVCAGRSTWPIPPHRRASAVQPGPDLDERRVGTPTCQQAVIDTPGGWSEAGACDGRCQAPNQPHLQELISCLIRSTDGDSGALAP